MKFYSRINKYFHRKIKILAISDYVLNVRTSIEISDRLCFVLVLNKMFKIAPHKCEPNQIYLNLIRHGFVYIDIVTENKFKFLKQEGYQM